MSGGIASLAGIILKRVSNLPPDIVNLIEQIIRGYERQRKALIEIANAKDKTADSAEIARAALAEEDKYE